MRQRDLSVSDRETTGHRRDVPLHGDLHELSGMARQIRAQGKETGLL